MLYLLVKTGDGHDDAVPDDEFDTERLVHLPAAAAGRGHQEDDGGEEGEGGVQQTLVHHHHI